ncbi:DUF1294 domain-containing protein [Pseudomonas mediterranea]|uniref:Uncharacterized membrane protein YsdA, DUF1294 family n=1 Tax=Pseudomonas mediterranea TaxID=183795 RepID=A0AAX2DE13_9PSED|nr:DUF1294 domain-containing protein [Pseudomonas mediterranea]KGU83489.1 membrane protein [Pseudomonas mediterranea CFBP 5447]MBL0841406.1 DUF1294 domain-containing protein [Pseudomonas mediterranea]MDU9027777.1 DUF1294 domain-containing protein [Pseudomonas mediterranea]QHA82614.1 DUF1294 domain-containing protein [Pseudomonas mediterranea]UZE03445.1 DUF1294 domain-containing protein [Pseudomonas mediterranea]
MNDSNTRRHTARHTGGAVQNLRLKLIVFALLCALPLAGSLLLGLQEASWVPLTAYGIVSVVAFLLYWSDKRKARSDAWRTPENVLHAVELAGGWPGALLAQQVFRHKTRKVSFQVVFWFIVLLHQAFWVDQLFLGGHLLAWV